MMFVVQNRPSGVMYGVSKRIFFNNLNGKRKPFIFSRHQRIGGDERLANHGVAAIKFKVLEMG